MLHAAFHLTVSCLTSRHRPRFHAFARAIRPFGRQPGVNMVHAPYALLPGIGIDNEWISTSNVLSSVTAGEIIGRYHADVDVDVRHGETAWMDLSEAEPQEEPTSDNGAHSYLSELSCFRRLPIFLSLTGVPVPRNHERPRSELSAGCLRCRGKPTFNEEMPSQCHSHGDGMGSFREPRSRSARRLMKVLLCLGLAITEAGMVQDDGLLDAGESGSRREPGSGRGIAVGKYLKIREARVLEGVPVPAEDCLSGIDVVCGDTSPGGAGKQGEAPVFFVSFRMAELREAFPVEALSICHASSDSLCMSTHHADVSQR